ncbi:M50 family metallopeptidase, partial [Xanthomonas citri pv. citri]
PHVFVALLVGAVLPFGPVVGRDARIAATIVHEVGHVVVVEPFGGQIRRLDQHPDGSGEAWVQLGRMPGAIRWLVRVLNLYAGYSAPLWAGVLLVTGVLHGSRWLPVAVLGVVGVVALLFVRNWFGLLVVIGFDAIALW